VEPLHYSHYIAFVLLGIKVHTLTRPSTTIKFSYWLDADKIEPFDSFIPMQAEVIFIPNGEAQKVRI
jgi:hypothetical protein